MCVCGIFIPTIIVIRALVAATLKLQPWAEILLFSGLFLCCAVIGFPRIVPF